MSDLKLSLDEVEARARDFLEEAYDTMCCALPDAGGEISDVVLNTENVKVSAEFVFHLAYGDTAVEDRTATVRSSDLYSAFVSYDMGLDRSGKHLAVLESTFQVRANSLIAIRFDYDRKKTGVPASHIHFSGTGELLSPAISRNNSKGAKAKAKKSKGDLQHLHVPVGGHRFRPSLEEFHFFVVNECGFRGMAGWQQKLLERRESWMDHQCAAAVRDAPDVAAQALKNLGYQVHSPEVPSVDFARHPGW